MLISALCELYTRKFFCLFILQVCLMSSCELFPPQGGGEAKTLTPKQCIIIDAGLESIKVGEDLQSHIEKSIIEGKNWSTTKFNISLWYFLLDF